MGLYGGGGDGGAQAALTQQQKNIDAGTNQINQLFNQYNSDFYAKRGQDYTDWATPQVMQQFQNTKNQLAYSLARNGTLNSSMANTRGQQLQTNLNQQLNNVAQGAQAQINTLKGQVSDAKTNLVNQLISSNDPSIVATQGAALTAGLNTAPSFNSLGNMFSDWSNTYLANMNARAYNPAVPSLGSQFSNLFA